MKTTSKALTLTLLLNILASPLGAQMRNWKNNDGSQTLRAQLLSRDDSTVTLKKTNGSTFTIPLEKLHSTEHDFLNKNHPTAESKKEDQPAGDAFGPLSFGDNRTQVEEKLLNSPIVKTKTNKTLFGRTGLNGIFETTHTIGGQRCFLYFDWSDSGNLREITLRTDGLDATAYESKLRATWNETINLFTKLYGKPVSGSSYPKQHQLHNGLMLASHLWRTSDGYSILLGPGQELSSYNVSVRITTKRVEPIAIP